jgi:TolB-like protein
MSVNVQRPTIALLPLICHSQAKSFVRFANGAAEEIAVVLAVAVARRFCLSFRSAAEESAVSPCYGILIPIHQNVSS